VQSRTVNLLPASSYSLPTCGGGLGWGGARPRVTSLFMPPAGGPPTPSLRASDPPQGGRGHEVTLPRYLLRRGLASVVTLIGISILIFGIARVIPGDPARIALGPTATHEQVAELRQRLGLDEPLPVQYLNYVAGVLRGDLGPSLYTNRSVGLDLRETFPATFELVLVSSLLMTGIGIPLGVIAARGRDGPVDHVTRLLSLLGVVTPSFVWAIFLMLVFSYFLGWLPVAGRLSEGMTPPAPITGLYLVDSVLRGRWDAFRDALAHIVLPAVALALSGIGQAARLTRANVAEAYNSPYIEMARAYGVAERRIAMKYALKPALIPTLTILGLDIAVKLGNAFLVETVFHWPGMARYGVQTILHKDLNGIVGTVLVIAAFFLIINAIVDFVVSLLNPRIRLGAAAR
jgi:peptide/nickel transport system permease protein